MADKEKTSWVLINFMTNAIKFSPESAEIIVKVKVLDDTIQFMVTDCGKGIEQGYLTHIFDRYYKVPDQSTSIGSGLGLTIAKEFIEAQNWHIWVKSKPGAGSTFGFDLSSSL